MSDLIERILATVAAATDPTNGGAFFTPGLTTDDLADAAAELIAARKVSEACRNARRLVSQGVPVTLTLSSAEVLAGETFTLVRLADWEAMKEAAYDFSASGTAARLPPSRRVSK